ncbi:MAG: hypothetical protein WEC39_01910 [Patescibacteria group bacterium]
MPQVSRTADRASDPPTFAQFKELFAQTEKGRITKGRLQEILRGTSEIEDQGWFRFTHYRKSLKEIRAENGDVFPSGNLWWEEQPFADESLFSPWDNLALRTSVVPGTANKPWEKQIEFLRDGEFVPKARQVVDGLIAYYRRTGLRLFPNCWLLVFDVTTLNSYRIRVQFNDADGILVDYGSTVTYRYSDLCIAVARQA